MLTCKILSYISRMKLNSRTLAIATTLVLSSLGVGVSAASAGDDEVIQQAGPVLTMEQLITIVQSAYPEAQVEKVRLEREDRGLVYEVDLTNDLDVYVQANTGQILDTDED
jgi:hypothetical protein